MGDSIPFARQTSDSRAPGQPDRAADPAQAREPRALTPGGPVIGFSVGAAALKGGAGAPQVIAYSTAWALFAVQRLFLWELPVMPQRLVLLRLAASLPLPFLAAAGAMLIGRP